MPKNRIRIFPPFHLNFHVSSVLHIIHALRGSSGHRDAPSRQRSDEMCPYYRLPVIFMFQNHALPWFKPCSRGTREGGIGGIPLGCGSWAARAFGGGNEPARCETSWEHEFRGSPLRGPGGGGHLMAIVSAEVPGVGKNEKKRSRVPEELFLSLSANLLTPTVTLLFASSYFCAHLCQIVL